MVQNGLESTSKTKSILPYIVTHIEIRKLRLKAFHFLYVATHTNGTSENEC